jgi:hypothetical protein
VEVTLPASDVGQTSTVTAPAFQTPEAVKTSGFLVALNLFFGLQNVTNRRNFASYTWNRRSNTQQFGEQQGIFPILGFDWRF